MSPSADPPVVLSTPAFLILGSASLIGPALVCMARVVDFGRSVATTQATITASPGWASHRTGWTALVAKLPEHTKGR